MTRAMSFWMMGLLALLPVGFSAQAADVGVTMLHKMDFEAVTVNTGNYIAPKDLGSGARAFPMSMNGGVTFNATKATGWNGSTVALGTGSSGIRFRNGYGLGASTATGWTLSFQAQAAGAPGNPGLGPIGMTLGKVGEGDNLSLHLNVNITNNQGYALAVKRANTTDIAADQATVTVVDGTNMAPFSANEWHHYAVRCVPDAGGGQPTFELWQDGERKGAIKVAGIADGTWVIKELLIGRTRGDGHQSTPEAANTNYQNAPGAQQSLDEVALFDRALSDAGVAWLKDNAAAVPPTDQPASVMGAVLGTMNQINVSNASVTTIKFGSSELALTGPEGASAIRAGTKLESVSVFFRDGGGSNGNAKYLVLTDTADKVLGVSDAAEPLPVAATVMTVAYPFSEAPTIDSTSTYRLYLTAQENLSAGDTFSTSNAVTARFLALQKATSSADFTFNTSASNYAPAMSFQLRVPRALNVNFTVGESPLVEGTDYGVAPYPAAQWRSVTTDATEENITITQEVTDTVGATVSLTAKARLIESSSAGTAYPLFRDTLMDSGADANAVSVELANIPYKHYDLYIYMAAPSGTAGYFDKNGPVFLNDDTSRYYYMEADRSTASVSATPTSWGSSQDSSWGTAVIGTNVLRIADLTDETIKVTAHRMNAGDEARGAITAIQVVEVPTHGLAVWSATLTGDDHLASTQPFTNTRGETKLLGELTEADCAEVTVVGAATLTLDAAAAPGQLSVVGGGTLTLAGAQTLTTEMTVSEGTLAVTAETAALEGCTITVASDATLAPRTTVSARVTGAGSVTIEAGQTGALANTANDFAGGTTVAGTLLWQGAEAYGTAPVTVNAGGVFDLNGLPCAQAVTLAGGALKGAFDAATDTIPAEAFSVNFNQDQGKVSDSETGGLVAMRGSYWVNSASASGTNQALTLVPYNQIASAGASTQALANALSWTCRGHWVNGRNQTSYLKGYLDENENIPVVLTFSLPEEKVKFGWDLYLYANTDTGGATFSAKDLTGDDGVTTSYTYRNGALVTGSTAGFGNSNDGTTTVAEGVNVLKVPGLTDRSLRVNSPNRNGRGCIAAVQGVFCKPNGYYGALTVTADSVLAAPEAGKALRLGYATVSGSGKLTKQGAGELRLVKSTFGAQTLAVAEGTCSVGEGNALESLNVTVGAGTTFAAEAGMESLALASLAGEGTVELGDLTALTLTGSGAGTASFTGNFTATTRTVAADVVCALIKRGANTQQLAQLPTSTSLTFEVQAQAGTLRVVAATEQTLKRLVTTGGTFATDGVGEVSVDFAQMASGAATFASRATAKSARPAMESAGDATVSKFTLAEGGKILYYSRADLAKYFPAGFIPEGEYTVQLGADLYSELSYPTIFTVMGAPVTARFTVLDSTGNPAPSGSWSASGNTITISDSSAITGTVEVLGAPKYHYTFNNGNLVKADDALEDGSLQNEGATYAASDNGKCLASGTPWSGGFRLESGAWSFGTYFRLKAAQEKDVVFGFGQAGTAGALYLTKGAGNTVTLWHNPTGSGVVELFTVPLAGSSETWNHLLLVHTEGTITCYINGVQLAVAKGDFAKTLTQFQVGSFHGGVGHGFTKWAGHDGQVDDLAVWSSALVGRQVTQAAAKVMGHWRWREGETPAEALDAAAADWQNVEGILGSWPGTADDSNYTAAVSITASASLEELVEAMASFPAREVLWDGAQVSFAAGETALALPAGSPRLAVANAVTVDLSGAAQRLIKAAYAGQTQVTLADGLYSGEVTLRNAPEGLQVALATGVAGLTVQVALEMPPTGDAYERTITANANWNEADAWTNLADSTTVDVPPAGATVFLTVTADATLTMGSERPELADLFVDGAGALTLDYGTLGLTEKDDYANAPFERTLLTVTAGVPENLTIRTSALNYGAYATIAYTETAVVATVNAPEGLWQESGTERIISINFADAEANKVTGTAQEGLAGYEVHAALWSQFVGTSQTGQVNAYDYADRADGSAAAVATGTLTYTAGTVWKTTAVDANARGLFKGYLDDNGSSNWADSTLRAEVVLPADWSARYTAILYKAADTNLDKTKFTPALINGVWYSYVNEVLTSLANFPASTLPGAEYDWGSLKARQEYTAGTNVMVVSGLSGQTFTTEKWASRGAWTSFDARGGLAAIQLKEEKSLEPGEAKTFIAEASGNLGWASLSWRDENGHGTGTPTATDAATIVLTDDLSLDLSGVSVKHLTICGNGHAVSFSHRAESTVGAWAFVNDTVLLLTQQGEALPANTVVYPKRVRYAYPYEGDVTTTNRYEQEFANSFTGALTPQGGLVEFSKGAVHFTGLAITATETDLVFSGNSAVTLDEGVPFSFGTANLIFKDTATVTAEAMRLCDEGPARTVNLAMTDDATITITGNVNDLRGNNSLLWPHWSGTLNASLRDRAKLIAEQTVMTLGCADADTLHARLTLADEAEIRVEGLYAYSDNASTSYDINLKGGKLLIGSRGWGAWNGVRPISLNFQGGTFGAWQDVELLSDTHRRLFSEVTGNPLFAGEATMTFASPVPMFTDTAARATVRSGGLVLQGKDFAALPSFQLQGGTLTLENCSPTMSSLTLSGGALDLAAGFPTVSALSIPADTIIRLPLREKLSEGGYITMADGRQIPAIAHAVFELALDPNRSETSRVLPLVPLVLGGYTEGTEPQVKGFGVLNNTNSAISDYAAVFRSGSAGRGLYAELKGNEVLKEHTVHLNAATEALEGGGYPLIQSTLDAYPYHIFSGELANAKVLVPEGGVALPHAAFIGTPITLVAQGSTPGTLLQGINYTFSTDVTFDLSAWAAAMPTLVRGAVKGVPASVCLISGGAVKAPASVRLKVDLGAYALPSGVEGSVEVTAQGVYYVLRYERRVRTLSVNFTESTVPLVAPPAQVGAYSLPIGGWNSLEGVFSSATLKLSDVGGVAQEAATAFADPDQPTQLLCYTSQTNLASSAGSSLLQVRLDDSTEQQLRLVNVPFEAYRVALIFANDLEGAAYATATINGSSYAMDAEGYTRRDIAGYTALDAKGNPSIDIPADTQWGSTDFTPASAPVTLGTNALVSDVLTASEVTIDLPGFTYAQRYAGLAALQIIEAPDATAAGQILTCAYTFTADGDDYELATLPLTGTATTWSNGPENLLSLTSDYDVTLTLPKSFEADRIICSGSGSITLRVEGNGGAALRELDAAQIANITVDFPAAGLVFAPASEVSRFEQSFDNCGNTYTIAAGATLALGEHSGIVTEFDDNGTATLDIDEANSRGVLRRDYPVTQTSNISRSKLTFAFKQGTVTLGTNNSTYSHLVEEGDTFRVTGKYFPGFNGELGTSTPWHWVYTQTGGQASFEGSGGNNDGICCFSSDDGAADSSATFNISGNAQTRFQLNAIRSWSSGVAVQVNVSEEATLALGASGFYHRNRPNSSYTATFSGQATLEAIAATLGATNVTPTFTGGRLTTKQPEANFTLPMVFTGTDTEPTIVAPERFSTIVLSGTNSGTGKISLTQGTLAIANASALGSASVTVKAGATFESRNFAGGATLSGKVSFASGSTCSATTTDDVSGGYTARIAGTLAFPDGLSTVTFRLNGTAYTVLDSDVDTANGTVAFRAGAQQALEDLTWNINNPGEWAEGGSASWVGNKTYWNGARVSFPAGVVGAERTVGPIAGYIRPGAFTMQGPGDGYRFTTDDGILDLRDCVASDGSLDLASGTIFDVPIALARPSMTLKQGALTLRLLGVMSNNYKTASLVGSGDVNGDGHGVWSGTTYNGDITWSPHAGEMQLLPAFGTQLAGSGKVTIAGQVAADGSVSGGTVQFAGNTSGTNWNATFTGSIEVRDGATLDFTMTRGDDNNPYFRQDGNSLADRDEPVFTLSNGATLRFTKSRNILGGYGQRTLASLIARQPIVIGYNCTLDYSYQSDNHQVLPYGLLLNGDGASIQINEKKVSNRQGIFVARGATITVAGIGDTGDLADPATDTTSEATAETYGKLTRGITATIAGLNENVGLVRLDSGIADRNDITLQVGDGSTLRLLANLTHPGDASSDTVAFRKTGLGRLMLEHPTIAARNTILVDEGVLGGSAELTHADSAITVETGATIEGGLRVPTLTIGAGATLALDATGVKPLRCDRALFTPNATVTVASLLPEGEIPSAANREPIKVMSWGSAQSVDSVSFVLADALVAAGYGLEVRDDGLYLMRNVVYVRELSFEGTPNSLTVAWFEPTGWYRQEEPATLRDFDPAENETATALFLLPSDRYTADSTAPQMTLLLTREANFSAVRVGVKVTEQVLDEAGNPVLDGEGNPTTQEVVRLLQTSVTYLYDLTNETMPGSGEAYAFSWVPTRLVEGPATTSLAAVTASIPTDYAYTLLDTTVVVYASATTFTPALNLNFTGKSSGDPAWVSLDAGNCGVVPYAGVYWNNLAANGGSGTELVADAPDGRMLLRAQATVAGVVTDEGQAATCEVTFISSGAETITSRRGDGNVSLSASFLKGQNIAPATDLVTQGGLTTTGVYNGWQVQVKNIPFANCDLYLLFAGSADGTVTYPAVRVKVGSGDWRTYSVANGFVAPADRTDVWRGRGSLVSGNFVNATNMLHLRLSSAIGESLEICAVDGQLGTPASVGLAALQIVQCTDGVSNVRLGTGNWSDPAGWARETIDGQQAGRWEDATDEAPRWASIPTTSYLTADMAAATPYLSITGGSDLLLNGTEGVLSTGTVDLYNALAGAKVTFAKELFAAAPNVVMAPNVTVCVPESAGSTTCDYRWVYDDLTRSGTASTEGTLQKTQAGDLTLTRKNLNKLQIDDGTLWLSTTADGDYTRAAAITGQGTLGKTGIGAVTLSADTLQLDGVTGLHVSQGTLNWIGGSRTYPDGQRHIIDGGTLVYDGTNAGEGAASAPTHLPNAVFEVSNGGLFRFKGNNALRKSLPSVMVENATVESNYNGSAWNAQDHPHIGTITLRNGTVALVRDPSVAWWAAWDRQGLVIHGSLIVESGSNNQITLSSNKNEGLAFSEENSGLEVAAGATITSHVGISGVQLSNDGPRKFTKRGPGTWIQAVTLAGPDRDLFEGVPIDIEGGTFSYRIGGATHTLADGKTNATITVKDGARLEGNVVFPAGSPIVIEEGGTLAPYVPGVAGSSISVQNLTLSSGAILEFDLANTTGGALKNAENATATIAGPLTIRLVNLPNTLTSEVQLTNFTVEPTGTPTISCPEAVALDATVQYKADTNGIKQLFLVPSGASYTWANQNGSWSEAKWQHGEAVDQLFPGTTSITETTPPARIQASTSAVELAVDKGNNTLDGKDWMMTGLVLTAGANRTITLFEELSTVTDPLPNDIALNRLVVKGALWKLGAGSATVAAPIAFYQVGEGSVNLAASTLTLTHPLLIGQAVNQAALTTVPVPIDIASGATLDFALDVSEEMGKVIAAQSPTYSPITQTLSGEMTGAGTLRLSGANNALTLTGKVDNSLAYEVTGAGANLTLSGTIPETTPAATRTLTLAAGTSLSATTESAFGWSPWAATLAASADNGARVSTTSNARFRGSVEVTGTGTATFGTTQGYLDGTTTFDVPANASLAIGRWESPDDTPATATLTKLGAGTLSIAGAYASNLPFTIAEGTVEVATNGSIEVTELNSELKAHWTLASGATLRLGNNARVNLNNGSLLVSSGATLDLAEFGRDVVGKVELQDGALIRIGGNGTLGNTVFKSTVTASGTIWVNLDALDPATFGTSGTSKSYPLLTFEDGGQVQGTGIFRLGGTKQVEWAKAGWTLRTTSTAVILEAFGGNNGVYTWAGTDDAHAWADPMWVLVSQDSNKQRGAWPTTEQVLKPYAAFLDKVTLRNTDDAELDYDVPEAARTVNWTLAAHTLAGLRCANDVADYTLTAENATAKTLSVAGEFLKTGEKALILQRPLELGADGALKLLGGVTRLEGALSSASGDFKKPLTLAGNAELAFLYTSGNAYLGGLFTGDGSGTIRFNSPGSLTVAAELEGLKTLAVDRGTVALTAADQAALAPTVTLAEGATLAYNPSTLAQGGAVKLLVNPEATAPTGILSWGAGASNETAKAPRLTRADSAPADVPSANVAELRYAPGSGHLILDPGHAVLPAAAQLTMNNNATVATAFWMGANTAAGTAFDYAGLTGSGLVSVEPVIDPAADSAWRTTRTLTLTLDPASDDAARTFRGTFAGALTADSDRIDAALTVQNAAATGAVRFVLAGTSESAYLGPLTVGERTLVEVTGSWFGPVTVNANGGELGGSGTVASGNHAVEVPEGALITASAIGSRAHADGSITTELIPTTLTVGGTLSMEPGSKLRVIIRNNVLGAAETSCVQAERLRLPTIVADPNNEVKLQVVIDDESGAIASNTKILGWNAIDGAGKINGTILDTDGNERSDYVLRQKSDGLYLYRSATRFWMILR